METLKLLNSIPLPTLIVIGGIALLLLSGISKISSYVIITQPRQKQSLYSGGFLVILGVCLYLASSQHKPEEIHQETTPDVSITEPKSNDPVGQVVVVKGVARNVSKEAAKWIYVFPTKERKFYLTQITTETEDAKWKETVYVGSKDDPQDAEYRIGIILANARTHKELLKNSQGLQNIPNNPEKLSERTVKRK